MRRIKKERTKIAISVIFVIIMLTTWIKMGMVIAQDSNNEKEEIVTTIEQNIEKYLNVENNQVLLQQRIVVDSNKKGLKKENETLQIEVPMIQDKKPEAIHVLLDGKVIENTSYHYDMENNQLTLKTSPKNQNTTYKIIYHYKEVLANLQEIQLNTKVNTKFENIQEIETKDEKVIEINPIGEKISLQGEITPQVYKGYLYEAKENQTNYEENYIIEVSDIQNVEPIKIAKEKEVFTDQESNSETACDSTYWIQTIINKAQMLDILGQEGKIIIQNEKEEVIQELTKDTKEENGNIIINYTEKEIKNIKILTTKPLQLGQIKISNKKAIDADTGYEKQQIQKFAKLESMITINQKPNTLQMNLIDTKSEVSFYMDKTELSTLQNNENIQMIATLQSNSNQYDLYKNPSIHILFPKELEINIKKITLLNFEDVMQIKNATLEKDSEGRKNLKIELEGEQEKYSNELNKGIQIAIIGDIQISNTTPSKQTQIEIACTNENAKQQETRTQYPLKINSKYGVLMINKLENYNQEQEIVETIDDKEVKIPLDVNAQERVATR